MKKPKSNHQNALIEKIIKYLGILSLLIIIGCTQKKPEINKSFDLYGELHGFENGTWIYLSTEGHVHDSTQVVDTKFIFKGELKHPTEFSLFTNNPLNYTQIWLEPKEIHFKANNGEFREAIITGSSSQIESEKLWKPVWEYRRHRDSLSKIVFNDTIDSGLKKKASAALDELSKNRLKIEKDFIKHNPDSYVSAATLDFYSRSLVKDTVVKLFENFNERLKNSSYGQSIERFIELNKNPGIGDKYVDFSMTNQMGEIIKLSDFEGRLILLDFWASWCGPCKEEYPALKEAYSKFNKKGFEIISISEDRSRQRWVNAIKDNDLDWVNLWSEAGNNSDVYLIYGINGIPDNFLIDENGIIIARNLRSEELIAAIEKYLEAESGN